MLSVLEKRVSDKILNIEGKKNKLLNRLNNALELEAEIRDLIEAHDNIKKSKKEMIIFIILSIVSSLLISVQPIFIGAVLYFIMGLFSEKSNIKENRERISKSYCKFSKDKDNLEKQFSKIVSIKEDLRKNIISENQKIKKYQKIKKDIEYVKGLENNINDNNFNMLKELYSSVPILAFSNKEEYNNYLSYNNDFIKNELIESKILSKKRK